MRLPVGSVITLLRTQSALMNGTGLYNETESPQLNITDSSLNPNLPLPLNGSSTGSSALFHNITTVPLISRSNTSFPLPTNISTNTAFTKAAKILADGCFDASDAEDDFDGNWDSPHRTTRNNYYRPTPENIAASGFAKCYAAWTIVHAEDLKLESNWEARYFSHQYSENDFACDFDLEGK
jgi:hypothetical protein